MSDREGAPRDPGSVGVLISVLTSLASGVLVLTASGAWTTLSHEPEKVSMFAGLTVALQLLAVQVYGRGAISVAGIGMLATGFTFGVGVAAWVAVAAAVVLAAYKRIVLHRALFNLATFSLATAAGTAVYVYVDTADQPPFVQLLPALGAGFVFWVVNIGLLTVAMSLSEGESLLAVWRERFRWLTLHYLAFGPLALACTIAYEKVGAAGLLAFALPPALLILSVRQYLERTRTSVEEVRQANADLRVANTQLGERNEDLKDLFQFAGGLAARAHDRAELVAYAERRLSRMTGATARIRIGLGSGGHPLAVGGHQVGSLSLVHNGDFDHERWERLRAAIVPQLATAIESTELVEKVRRTHLATIAALSRSIEAKDFYTSGHTERVATLAIALARRLGFTGPDVSAIEIGALLHDVGKIGIPEQVLQKPTALTPEEWQLVKQHPVISDRILSEIDLPELVHEIARWSHERIDGMGYPDGLSGEEIPLAARIVFVADAFDALTTDRPYREARSPAAALRELRDNAGTQFCPRVVEALEAICREEPHLLTEGRVQAIAGELDRSGREQPQPLEAVPNLRDLALARLDKR
jgi:putative nucleotidyltransferase with HDIG domain